MQYMDQSLVNQLWQEILQEVERIKRIYHRENHGSSRSPAMAHSDGRTLSSILDITIEDGSHVVYHVIARKKADFQIGPEVQVSYDKYYHNNDKYWELQLSDRNDAVVIDHVHYRIGPEKSNGSRGFGGRKFLIEFNEGGGKVISTTNLWYQGPIPPAHWDKFPDNARFVELAKPTTQ